MEFDFSQNQTVPADKFESTVPQDFRGLYIKDGDSAYKLGSEDEGVKSAVAAAMRLNNSLKASRAEAKTLKGKAVDLAPLSEFGANPEEIAEAFSTRLKEAGKGKSAEDIQRQVDKIKADLLNTHKTELEKATSRSEALRRQLHNILVTSEATAALAEAQALDPEIVMPFIANQVKVVEENDEFKVSVVDKAGDVRYSGVTSAPLTIRELVAELKQTDKYKPLFKSEAPAGSGAPPGRRQSGLPKGDDMTATQKIAQGLGRRK